MRSRSRLFRWAWTWRVRGGVGEREPVFGPHLFVGRLAEKKGVDVLLSALAEVPDATLVVGGDGPDAERLRALSGELGVAGRVRFAGRLSRPMIRDELRSAYAVVIPSKVAADGDQDTTPLVMSESMSAAVPSIVSRLGGLAEQIEPDVTGLLAEPDSAGSLADTLREALADPERLAGYGRQARDRIRGSALDLRTTVARYAEILGAEVWWLAGQAGRVLVVPCERASGRQAGEEDERGKYRSGKGIEDAGGAEHGPGPHLTVARRQGSRRSLAVRLPCIRSDARARAARACGA